MSVENQLNIPKWFKTVAIVAIVWNGMGIMAYIAQMVTPPEMMFPDSVELQKIFAMTPNWAKSAFALAVWGGLAGSIGLLMKKSWSFIAFVISVIGILLQQIHNYFMTDMMMYMAGTDIIFPTIVLLIGFYLVYLANDAKSKGWIK